MEPRELARMQAIGRVAFGTALALAPSRTGAGWTGRAARQPGAQVFASGLGARDLALALGTLAALQRGTGARPWLLAGALADAGDAAATIRARARIPRAAAVGVTALAAGSTALGLYLQRSVD